MATPKERLLARLEDLTHAARIRRMVELGREATTSTASRELIAELAAGSIYERRLALASCFGSRDGTLVKPGLSDSSPTVRGLAVTLAPHLVSDPDLAETLLRLSGRQRRVLLRRLRRTGRVEAIDLFLSRLDDPTAAERSDLFPYGSAATVNRLLAQAADDVWIPRRLAGLHPERAAELIEARLGAGLARYPRLQLELEALLNTTGLAGRHPDLALRVLTGACEHGVYPRSLPEILIRRRPSEVAALCLAHPELVAPDFGPAAQRLTDAQLAALLPRAPALACSAGAWLRRLPPARRLSLFARHGRLLRDSDGLLSLAVLQALPAAAREPEARRCFDLPLLATRPLERIPYAACLPPDEVEPALSGFLGHPDAEQRAAALVALVGAARYSSAALRRALDRLRARKHEQDPVRGAFLGALVAFPPGKIGAEHLEALDAILQAALDAADLSHDTGNKAMVLVLRLLPRFTSWGAKWLAELVRSRGHLSLWGMQWRLTDDEVRAMAPGLEPLLRAWEVRERERFIAEMALCFGRRLRVFDALAASLGRVAEWTKDSYTMHTCLACLREHRSEAFRALVPRLVDKDRSTITVGPVLDHLHRHRQDLLTPFLGQTTFKGRFSTGRSRWVLPLFGGFFRWTPAQQKIFADVLTHVAIDRERDAPAVLTAIRTVPGLMFLAPRFLLSCARSSQLMVRDTALRALARVEDPAGVAELLAALDDDRARVAIYALRAAVLELPEPAALAILRQVPRGQVTVTKEVVRLLGELPGAEAFAALLRFDTPELHRDVRVALLRALWGHLGRPQAWEVIDAAAEDPDPATAASVAAIPDEGLSASAFSRLAGLFVRLLEHPSPTVRGAALDRLIARPFQDPDNDLVRCLLRLLPSRYPDDGTRAGQALFAVCRSDHAALLGTELARLLPARRAMVRAVHGLLGVLGPRRRQLDAPARSFVGVLESDPLLASLWLQVALPLLPWPELAGRLAAQCAALHADGLGFMVSALTSVERPDIVELETFESTIAGAADARLRRLALAALTAAALRLGGWTEERLARLERYRRDPDPLVGGAAQLTFPPEENVEPRANGTASVGATT